MGRYHVVVWQKKRSGQGSRPLHTVQTSDRQRALDTIGPWLHKKYPENWVAVFDTNYSYYSYKGEAMEEWAPRGFDKRAKSKSRAYSENRKTAQKVQSERQLQSRYGERETPLVMYRPGKSKKRMGRKHKRRKETKDGMSYGDSMQQGMHHSRSE